METLLTGATGLLARHLIPALQARGDSVRALVLPAEDATWLAERNVAVYRGDVRQFETLVEPMRHVDRVFHLAGMMGVWRPQRDYHDVNVTGTEHVCRAVLAAGVRRLVHVSSWTVYGMGHPQAVGEDFPLAPFPEPYALTKTGGDLVVQRLIAAEGLPAVIVRPDTFFGPGDRLHFSRIADRLRHGSGIVVGSGRNILPFIYVTDIVHGLLLAANAERAVGQAYNIAHDHPFTQQAFLEAVAQEIGAKPPRIHVPYRALYAAAYAAEQVGALAHSRRQPIITRLGVRVFGDNNHHSMEKARRDLGYAPQVSLLEGVRRAADWYREQYVPAATPALATTT